MGRQLYEDRHGELQRRQKREAGMSRTGRKAMRQLAGRGRDEQPTS